MQPLEPADCRAIRHVSAAEKQQHPNPGFATPRQTL